MKNILLLAVACYTLIPAGPAFAAAAGGIREEARQTMANIRTTLEAHGYSTRDLVKCTVMLADMSEWSTFNEVYQSFLSRPYPARSALGVSGLAFGARVEVECIAATGT